MTQEEVSIAETYKQLADAEKQALILEKMLDNLDSKMDSILEEIKHNSEETSELLQGEDSDVKETKTE